MHPFFIDPKGSLYVDVATATNSCQLKNRTLKSPGAVPCTELETRGGVWRFDADKTDQKFSAAERYATGIRNAEGFGYDAKDGNIFITQHGRDQLHANWPELYKPEEEATLPSEEVMLLKQGGDYGWPECYYDPAQKKLLLAPEYGGDGGHAVGVCASKTAPVAAFPAHWGPNGMAFYDQTQFPSRYRDGLFIAFHGSWDRAPYPQGGYNIVYQPLTGNHSAGECEIFADGFAGPIKSPDKALHRPSGVAVAPDGALFVADDVGGRIYRITYKGGSGAEVQQAKYTPCPSLTAPAGEIVRAEAKPPEGTHPDAGLSVPPGATTEMVALGDRVYHGEVGGAPCTGCHGANAKGTSIGPDLTNGKWVWSDGSWKGIAKTITDGVPLPKNYRSTMPAMGGAQLTPDQVSAVAAYVWALNQH
jgi:mono/diheme cytochrome c family protein